MRLWELILFLIFSFIPGIKGSVCMDTSFVFLIIQFHFMIEHMHNILSRRKYEYCQLLFIVLLFGNIIPETYLGYGSVVGNGISVAVSILAFIVYAIIIHFSYKHINQHRSDHNK